MATVLPAASSAWSVLIASRFSICLLPHRGNRELPPGTAPPGGSLSRAPRSLALRGAAEPGAPGATRLGRRGCEPAYEDRAQVTVTESDRAHVDNGCECERERGPGRRRAAILEALRPLDASSAAVSTATSGTFPRRELTRVVRGQDPVAPRVSCDPPSHQDDPRRPARSASCRSRPGGSHSGPGAAPGRDRSTSPGPGQDVAAATRSRASSPFRGDLPGVVAVGRAAAARTR